MQVQSKSNYEQNKEHRQVTIAASGTTSTTLDLGGTKVVGIEIPSVFTGTKLAIQGSINGDFYALYGSETGLAKEIKVSAAPSFILVENPFDCPFEKVRFVSNATESAERIINVICAP